MTFKRNQEKYAISKLTSVQDFFVPHDFLIPDLQTPSASF
jgi:hypothetical protein